MHSNHQVKSAGAFRIRCAGTLKMSIAPYVIEKWHSKDPTKYLVQIYSAAAMRIHHSSLILLSCRIIS